MNIASNAYWENLKKIFLIELGSEVYNTFFMKTKFQSFKNGDYKVLVKNYSVSLIFNNHFKKRIESKMFEETKLKINFVPVEENSLNYHKEKNKNDNTSFLDLQSQQWYENHKPLPKFTFDTFVQGPSNNKALKSAEMICSKFNSLNINPLFIYGDSGLGKTHLLNAIGNEFLKQNPNLKVVYIPANEFVASYIAALGHIKTIGTQTSMGLFTNNFLNADVLLLDDVQSFNSKTETSETFFNIFNHLVNNNKKIIIASDKNPKFLKGIEERLITRFNQGMTVPVLKPGTELSIAFLKNKLKISFQENPELVIKDDVLEYFAVHFGSDFRSLNEIINSLSFHVTLIPTNVIDLNYVQKHLKHKIQIKAKNSWKRIVDYVANYFEIYEPNLLIGKSRKKELVFARNCCIWLIRKHNKLSYKQIGNIFSNRDHSTIIHSELKINEGLKRNEKIKQIIKELEGKIMFKN